MTDRQSADTPLVFISYSKVDRPWLDKYLLVHLRGLEKAGLISPWSDDRIDRSGEWMIPLVQAMSDASVAICLLSPNYLDTDFCVKDEIPYLIERAEKDGLHLLLLLVEPCDFQAHPWLAKRQFFLDKGQSVAIEFKGRENRPFAWLSKHIREHLGDRVEAPDKLPVSDVIKEALAALKEDAAKKPDVEPKPVVEETKPPFPALADDRIDIERLPVTGAELFGRQKELGMLDEAWDSGALNIVALRAWGGVGKSTLLNKWVEGLSADNYRGARRTFAWSFYSQGTTDSGQSGTERATSADAFIDAALRFFGEGEPAQGSPWARGERLADLVGQEKALLLLDGMEPLQDRHQGIKDPALSRLIECLAAKNAGLCVITTRERVLELLDFAETTAETNLEQLSREAGRALLRIKGVRGGDAELEAASEAFGNHALAIKLLASFLRECEGRHVRFAAKIPALADQGDHQHRHPRRVMAAFAKRFGAGPALDLLHMMGLFDRPADAGCIQALRAEPAIPGLTDELAGLDEAGWLKLLVHLRDLGLLAPASRHDPDELDAHPLVREHFGTRLRAERPDAWRAGHLRLYEHLKSVPEKRQPDTLAEMAPLFQAVFHGCAAGRHQEAFGDIYRARIVREDEGYLVHKLGALGTDLGVIAAFFDPPWEKPTAGLSEAQQAWLLNHTAFCLRALGHLRNAVAPMRAGLERWVEQENWLRAASSNGNLCHLHLTLGDVALAVSAGETGIVHADQSGHDFQRIVNRTTLANALLHQGDLPAAKALFEEAEKRQAKSQPARPRLYSVWGYRYCDLLLTIGCAKEVRERAQYALDIVDGGSRNLHAIALDHLSLSQAALALGKQNEAGGQLDRAVEGLRKAGRFDHIPRGLLARAALFRETGDYGKARDDLDLAMRIAKRGEMRLHRCDAHLEHARLALAQEDRDAARKHLQSAAALVSACGYGRRTGEVEELERALA